MKEFAYRLGPLEARIRATSGSEPSAELVHHESDGHVYVVAHFIRNREGYYLTFVGSRPFIEDAADFMAVAQQAQKFLDGVHASEE